MPDNLLTKFKKFFAEDSGKKDMTNKNEKVSPEANDENPSSVSGVADTGSEKIEPLRSADTEETTAAVKTELKNETVAGEKIEQSPEVIKEEVIKVLKTCYDPEIPVDIWELGLVYDIVVATNRDVLIIMTLTSPSCPVAGILPGEVEQKVREHPMVHDCKVELTFDPPWSQNMMSEVAKLELGFL